MIELNDNLILKIIQNETDRISKKYNKDFLDCFDVANILGVGRDNARSLFSNRNFPSIRVGKRTVISVSNFVMWITLKNLRGEYNEKK